MQTQFIWQYCYALCRNVQGSAYLIQIGCQGIVTHYGFFCSWQSVHDIEQTKSWSTRFRTQWDSPWPKMLILFSYFFIFSASRRNTRAKHHHSRNIADKGGESVVFPVVSPALSSFCGAKYGSLTAEKSSRAQKGQKKKKDPPCAWHWFLPIYGLPSGWLSPISWVIFGSRLEVLSVFFTWSVAVMWMDNEV